MLEAEALFQTFVINSVAVLAGIRSIQTYFKTLFSKNAATWR